LNPFFRSLPSSIETTSSYKYTLCKASQSMLLLWEILNEFIIVSVWSVVGVEHVTSRGEMADQY